MTEKDTKTSANASLTDFDQRVYIDKKQTIRKTGVGLLLLIVGFLGAMSQLFSAHFSAQLELVNIRVAEFMGVVYEGAPHCSGHGVAINNGKCLCDLGFAGPVCSEAVSSYLTDPIPNTILLVTNQFGQVNPKRDLSADSSYTLAMALKKAGYIVSVLYIGDEESSMFWKFERELVNQGISISKLTALGLNYGNNPIESRSYETYQYLIRNADQYSIVHFNAASGAGYFTLLAQKQGLICSRTKFVVGVDSLTPSDMARIESNNPEFVVTDVNTLKLDYIVQKSVEMAVSVSISNNATPQETVVISSKFLLDNIRERSWSLPSAGTHVIDMIPSSLIKGPAEKHVNLKELVYVGHLTTLDGLKVFCEAIDNVASELGKSGVSVSFVGIPSTIDDVPSDEWIDIYAGNWDEYGIKWSLVKAQDTTEIISYIAKDSGRVAIMPTLFDGSSAIGQELLYGGFPLIVSTESALVDLILKGDRDRATVKPNVKALSKRFKQILYTQVTVPRPAGLKATSAESWIELHMQLSRDESSTCVKKYEDDNEFPLVSIVLVHHNRGQLLRQAVESIEAQTYPNIEVVLVDDGSTDKESIKIMEDITWGWWENKGWKVIREKNKYLGAARNTGVKHSVGKFVVFMDDDDIAKPHQVETLVKVAINRGAEVVTSGHDVFTGMNKPFTAKTQTRYLPIGPAILAGMLENVFGDSKMLVNRESFVAAGGFTEDFGVGFEDYEFLAKMALRDKVMEAVSEPLNWYRRHNEAMSYQTNLKANQLRMLRAYADVNEYAPKTQQNLLQYTQEMFFNRHGVRAFEFDGMPSNSTTRSLSTSHVVPSAAMKTETIQESAKESQSYIFETIQESAKESQSYISETIQESAKESQSYIAETTEIPYNYISSAISSNVYQTAEESQSYTAEASETPINYFPSLGSNIFTSAYQTAMDSPSNTEEAMPTITPEATDTPLNYFSPYNYISSAISSNVYQTAEESQSYTAEASETLINYFSSVIFVTESRSINPIETTNTEYVATATETSPSMTTAAPQPAHSSTCPQGLRDCSNKCPQDKGFGFNIDCQGRCRSASDAAKYDQCGICGGRGITCIDCNNVVNGTATEDICGVCAGTGSACNVYKAIEPNVVPNKNTTKFTIYGAGFVNNGSNKDTIVYVNDIEIPREQLEFTQQQWIVVAFGERVLYSDIDTFIVRVEQYGQKFDSIPLYVYDPTSSTVDSIIPVGIQQNTIQLETLEGSFLAIDNSIANATCIFDDKSTNGKATPATLIDGKITCKTPSFGISQAVSVFVSYTTVKYPTPSYSVENVLRKPYFLDSTADIELHVFESAPIVSRANFADSGSSIYVEFEHDIYIINSTIYQSTGVPVPLSFVTTTCSQAFKSNYGALYNSDKSCTLTQPSSNTLILNFAYGSSQLIPGDSLVFKSDSIVKRNCKFCSTLNGKVKVYGPDHVTNPMVLINGPSVIGPCHNLTLDLSSVTGKLGRPWKSISMKYTVEDSQGSTAALSKAVLALEQLAIKGETMLLIQNSDIPLGSFSFSFVYENFLGGIDEGLLSVIKQSNDIPYVVILSENGFAGLRTENIQILRAKAILECPATDGRTILYNWQALDNALISPSDKNLSSVTFDKYTFAPMKDYSFKVTYGYVGEIQTESFYKFSTAQDIITSSAGVSRTIGDLNTISLSPIIIDEAYELYDPTSFNVTYFCSTYPMKGVCLSKKTGNALSFSATSKEFDLSGDLTAGQGYIFGIQVVNKKTLSRAFGTNSLIMVVQGALPVINIFPSYLTPGYSQTLNFDTSISGVTSYKNVKYSWKTSVSCAGNSYKDHTLVDTDIASSLTGTSLKLAEGALLPSFSYCFEVIAKDTVSGLSGRSNIQVTLLDLPRSGSCYPQESKISASSTARFMCTGWAGESLPLRYEFSVKKSGQSDWTILSPQQGSETFFARLPPGIWMVSTSIYDSTYSFTKAGTYEIEVAASLKRSLSSEISSDLSAQMMLYQRTQDIQSALVALAVAAARSPVDMTTVEGIDIITASLEFFNPIFASRNLLADQDEAAPYLASILSKLVGTVIGHNTVTVDALFEVLEGLTGELDAVDITHCYTTEITTRFLSVFDALIVSLKKSASYSTYVSSHYNSVITSIRNCRFATLACREFPYSFNGTLLNVSFGRGFIEEFKNVCSFTIESLKFNPAVASSQCVDYQCSSNQPFGVLFDTNFVAASSYYAVGNKSTGLSFYDYSENLDLKSNSSFNGFIVDESLSSWDFKEYLAKSVVGGGYKPVVARIQTNENYTSALFDTSVAIITKVEGNKYYFNATDDGTFTILVADNGVAATCDVAFRDCSGRCAGIHADYGYNFDCSGQCVPPRESLKYDQCGICGGIGNTCLDCKGTVNGTAENDLCGECAGTGSACNLYIANEPNVIPNKVGVNFTIYGAGFFYDKNDVVNNTHVFINNIEVDYERLTFIQQQWIVVDMGILKLKSDVDTLQVRVEQFRKSFDPIPIFVYNPKSSQVNSISPVGLPLNTSSPEVIKGAFLTFSQNVANTTCIFDDGSTFGKTAPATLLDGALTCTSPPFGSSGDVPVHIIYSAPRYSTPYFLKKQNLRTPYYVDSIADITLHLYEAAPSVTKAFFDDSGASIHVVFSDDIFVMNSTVYTSSKNTRIQPIDFSKTVYCSTVFGSNSKMLYDVKEKCILTQTRGDTLVLSFEFLSSSASPGDLLVFEDSTIVRQNCKYCFALSGTAVIDGPAHTLIPSVVVSGPSIIGPCADLTIDLSQTFGQISHPWKDVTISYTSSNVVDSTTTLDAYLRSVISQLKDGTTSFDIPRAKLPLGSYSFTFSFTNFFGGKGSSSLMIMKQSQDVPYVVVSSDNGNTGLKVNAMQVIRAKALLKCQSTKDKFINYEWSNDNNLIPTGSKDLSTLTFPKYTFAPSTSYSYKLLFWYDGEKEFAVSTTYLLSLGADTIYASAGISRTVGVGNTIKLKPIIFSDAYKTVNLKDFKVSYVCTTTKSKGNCISAKSNSQINFGTSSDGVDLTGQLATDTNYVIGITVRNIITGSTAIGTYASLIVVPGKLPVIDIHPSHLVIGHLEDLLLTTDLSAATDVTYSWSTKEKCAEGSYAQQSLAQSDAATPLTAQDLKLEHKVLKAATSYCFEVVATETSTGKVGRSNIQARVLQIPDGGVCAAVGSTSGAAYSTMFSIQCQGWTSPEESSPLKYQFSAKLDDDSSDDSGWIVIVPAQSSALFTSVLPAGNWKIQTVVVDDTFSSNDESTVVSFTVSAAQSKRALSSTASKDVLYLQNAGVEYSHTQDIQNALSNLGLGVLSLPSNIATDDGTAVQSAVVDLVNLIDESRNWYIDQDISAPFIASLVEAIVGRVNGLGVSSSEKAFSVLKYLSVELSKSDPENCYREEITSSFLTALDGIVSSYNASSSQFSPTLSAGYQSTISVLRSCRHKEIACGQGYTYTGSNLITTYGRNYVSEIDNICDYTIASFGTATPDLASTTCVSYACKSAEPLRVLIPAATLSAAISDAKLTALAVGSSSLEFISTSILSPTIINFSGADITGFITDDWLSANYDISSFVAGNGGGYKPVVAVSNTADYSMASFSTTGVSFSKVEGNRYYFTAGTSGSFALLVAPNPEKESASCPGSPKDCTGKCPLEVGYNSLLQKDCNDKCGVPGTPGFQELDRNNICGGNGAYRDCSGTIGGSKEIDVCGDCRETIEEPACFIIAATEPAVIPNVAGTVVNFIGSQFSVDTIAKLNNVVIQLVFVSKQRMTFTLTSSSLSPSGSSVGTAIFTVSKSGQQSRTTSKYYDPSKSILTSIAPAKTFVDDVTVFAITGINIIREFNTAICVFYSKDSDAVTQGNLTILSSETATCQGSFGQDGDITVNVLYSKPEYDTPSYNASNLNRPGYFVRNNKGVAANLKVKVFQTAPNPTRAYFDSTGASIFFEFDSAVSLIADTADYVDKDMITAMILGSSNNANCSMIFVNPTAANEQLWREGFDADCVISQVKPNKLRLQFRGEFTLDASSSPIIPGKKITLAANAIVNAGATYSAAASGSLIAEEPIEKPLPVVVITAPTLIGSCVNFTLDLSASYGSAGRNWKSVTASFTSVQAKSSNGKYKLMDESLNSQSIQVAAGFTSTIKLVREIIPEDLYEFTVVFTNFLGGDSSATSYLKKVDKNDIPYIVLTSDNGRSNLDNSVIQIMRASNIPIIGCGPQGVPVAYKWNAEVRSINAATIQFSEAAREKSALVVELYKFEPNRIYPFTVSAKFDDPAANYKSYDFDITVISSLDVIFANAGASRSVGTGNPLPNVLISATIKDSAYETLDTSLFQCTWKCIDYLATDPNSAACLSVKDGFVGVDVTTLMTKCFQNDLSGHLKTTTYKFAVTVVNSDTTSVALDPSPSFLTVIDGNVPLVNLVASELSPGSYSDTFHISGVVDETTASIGNIEYIWDLPDNCFGTNYLPLKVIKGGPSASTLTSPDASTIVFVPGKLLPGGEYCMRLTIKDTTNPNNPGSANLIVKVRDAPFGGICVAAINSGVAFSSDFEFRCKGWITDALSNPINYVFFIRSTSSDYTPTQKNWDLIGPQGASSQFTTKLSTGFFQIRSQIVDSASSINLIDIIENIEVTPPPSLNKRSEVSLQKRDAMSNCAAGITFIASASNDFTKTSNALAAITALSVGISGIPKNAETGAVDVSITECGKLQDAILAMLDVILRSGNWYLDTIKAAPFCASLLKGSTSNDVSTQKPIVENLFNITHFALESISNNSKTLCYGSSTATTFLSAIEVVLASLQNNGDISASIASQYNAVMRTINECQYRALSCDQAPYIYSGLNYLSYQTGIQSVANGTKPQFCDNDVTVVDWGVVNGESTSGCQRFTCKSLPVNGLLSTSDYNSIVNKTAKTQAMSYQMSRLQFTNSDNTEKSFSGAVFQATVSLDDKQLAQYKLKDYNPANVADNLFVLRPVKLEFPGDGYSGATYNSSGIKIMPGKIQGSKVRFEADSAGSFAILIQSIDTTDLPPVAPPRPTVSTGGPTSEPTSSNSGITNGGSGSGAIIGGVVGAAVALILVAGAIFAIRRRRDQQRTPKIAPSPQAAESAVAAGEAVIIQMSPEPVVVRTRDPAALPNYQMPPTYDEFMVAKGEGRENEFGPQEPDQANTEYVERSGEPAGSIRQSVAQLPGSSRQSVVQQSGSVRQSVAQLQEAAQQQPSIRQSVAQLPQENIDVTAAESVRQSVVQQPESVRQSIVQQPHSGRQSIVRQEEDALAGEAGTRQEGSVRQSVAGSQHQVTDKEDDTQ